MSKQKIAIIGAGLSGLVLAKKLQEKASVTLFEKARGVSGRLATRTTDNFQFDHGAQFFIAKTESFKNFLQPFIADGCISYWDANFVETDHHNVTVSRRWGQSIAHYVAQPKMTSFAKKLAEDLTLHLKTEIVSLARDKQRWILYDKNGNAWRDYDWVITTAPAEQSAALLPQECTFHQTLQQYHMLPCYSLMLGFDKPLALPWQAACVKNSIISWVSINSSKPGRAKQFAVVVLASNKWAQEFINADNQWISEQLLQEFFTVSQYQPTSPSHQELQRWRYANIGKQQRLKAFCDPQNKLAACGDWCIQGLAESAFLSANSLAGILLKCVA